jgi:hypothetical protein
MMEFLRAHGFDPGPLQRPLLAGALTGLAATAPGLAALVSFGSFAVIADRIMQLPRALTALLLIGAFTLAGLLYGLAFRRAANDRRGGWLFGAVFGFVLWMAAPLVVLPVISGSVMAAGPAAIGFLTCFLLWGTVTGGLFPYVQRQLHVRLGQEGGGWSLGPGAAALRHVLRRVPGRWR